MRWGCDFEPHKRLRADLRPRRDLSLNPIAGMRALAAVNQLGSGLEERRAVRLAPHGHSAARLWFRPDAQDAHVGSQHGRRDPHARAVCERRVKAGQRREVRHGPSRTSLRQFTSVCQKIGSVHREVMPGGCLERWGRRTFAPDNFQSTSWKRAVSYEEKLSHTDLKGKEVFPESFSSLSSRYHSKVDRDSCSGFVLLQRATTRRGRKASSATWATITGWSWMRTGLRTSATSLTTPPLTRRFSGLCTACVWGYWQHAPQSDADNGEPAFSHTGKLCRSGSSSKTARLST